MTCFNTAARLLTVMSLLSLPLAIVAAPEAGRTASIVEFGAVGDGATLNTEKIQSAIEQLGAKGGGTVVVPPGVFMTGALFLKPGVNLHLEKDAVLKGTSVMTNYPEQRIRIEGHFEEKYSSGLINAEGCDGLQITGAGTLDGNGRPIWDLFWKLRKAATERKNFRNLSIPRAQLCIINNSKNVLVDGVTFKDSQYWNLHLYNCTTVRVQNARFEVPDDYKQAPSTDGVDVDSCQDVEITNCFFSVTDDCIAMKGTWRPFALEDTASMPVDRVRISGCTFKRGGAALTCGSDASVARNLILEGSRVIGAMPVLLCKLRADTPQTYENIEVRNITVDHPGCTVLAILPWIQYIDLQGQPPPKSTVRNITVSGVKGRAKSLAAIMPNPGQTTISDITLRDIDVRVGSEKLRIAKGISNLKFENVSMNGKPVKWGAHE